MMKRFNVMIACCAITIISLSFAVTVLAEKSNSGAQKKIIVKIEQQKLYAIENNKLIYEYDVVTGRNGKETTVGTYKIFKKYRHYTSKTYGSKMPYTMFFSVDGKAIHATRWAEVRSFLHAYITESVGSYGCVGLTEKHAENLFNWAPMGTPILVLEGRTNESEKLRNKK